VFAVLRNGEGYDGSPAFGGLTTLIDIYLSAVASTRVIVEWPLGTQVFNPDEPDGSWLINPGAVTEVRLPIATGHLAANRWHSGFKSYNAIRVYSVTCGEGGGPAEFSCFVANAQVPADDQSAVRGASTDAAVVIPTDAWDRVYSIMTNTGTERLFASQYIDQAEFAVVAIHDNTFVHILPTQDLLIDVDTSGGQSSGDAVYAAGQEFSIELAKGEGFYALSLATHGPACDLTGTRIWSTNHPIGVVSGNVSTDVPSGLETADHVFDYARPVTAWGSDALVCPLPWRTSNANTNGGSFYKVAAGEDGTYVFLDNARASELGNKFTCSHPEPLALGDWCTFGPLEGAHRIFGQDSASGVGSPRSISVAQFMTSYVWYQGGNAPCPSASCCNGGAADCNGDPDMTLIDAVAQYLPSYAVSTVNPRSQINAHFLMLAAPTAHVGDIIVTSNGVGKPITAYPEYSSTVVAGTDGDWTCKVIRVAPANYQVMSNHPGDRLGVWAVGYGKEVSYQYSGGAYFRRSGAIDQRAPDIACAVDSVHQEQINCTAYDNYTEDTNGNGVLDWEADRSEDENGNFRLDEDSGVAAITLLGGAANLTLEADFFPEGAASVEFALNRPTATSVVNGTVRVRDVVGNVRDYPVVSPTAVIEVRDGENHAATSGFECEILSFDGSNSSPSADLAFAWYIPQAAEQALPNEPVASGPFVRYALRSDAGGICDDSCITPARLVVRNPIGLEDSASTGFAVVDSEPAELEVSGPLTREVGQEGCFEVAVNLGCDSASSIVWDFGAGSTTNGLVACHTWNSVATHVFSVIVTDSDNDTIATSYSVNVVSASPAWQAHADALEVTAEFHSCDSAPVGTNGAYIRHRASLTVTNVSDGRVPGRILVGFDGLDPAGTLLNEAGPELTPPLGVPYRVITSNGLEPGASTSALDFAWDVSTNALTGLSYTALGYASQLPPYFVQLPAATATEGSLYVSRVEAVDPEGEPVYYALAGSPPADLHLDPVKGVLTWRPDQKSEGLHAFQIIARDGHLNSAASTDVVINVAPVNVAPRFLTQPLTVATVGNVYTYGFAVIDDDGDVLSLDNSLLRKPDGAGIASNGGIGTASGELTWATTNGDEGVYPVRISVRDDGVPSKTVSQPFSLRVLGCTTPVAIDPLASVQHAIEGLPFIKQLKVSPSDAVTYRLEVGPAGMDVSTTGLLTWTPGFGLSDAQHTWSGTVRVAVTRVDGDDVCTDVAVFTIEVVDRNTAPVILEDPTFTATENVQYAYRMKTADEDGDAPRFKLLEHPQGMNINPATGLITWRPSHTAARPIAPDVNPYPVKVQVSDAHGAHADREFTILVAEVDEKPIFSSTAPTAVLELTDYDYPVFVTDPDGEAVTLTLKAGPPGMALDGDRLRWNAIPLHARDNSPYSVVLEALDEQDSDTGERKGATQTFALSVYRNNWENRAPRITQIPGYIITVLTSEQLYNGQVIPVDDDGDELEVELHVYEMTTNGPVELTSPGITSNGEFTWEYGLADDGKIFRFLVVAFDGLDFGTGGWFVRVLEPGNYPPKIISSPIQQAKVGEAYRYTIVAQDENLESSQHLDFQLVPAPPQCDYHQTSSIPSPAGVTITNDSTNTRQGILTWTPTVDQVGQYAIAVRAVDPWSPDPNEPLETPSYDEQCFSINVSRVGENHAPFIPMIGSNGILYAKINRPLPLTVAVEDPDVGDVHLFELMVTQPGASINPNNGEFSWQPEHNGFFEFEVRATDSEGSYYQRPFAVYVSATGGHHAVPRFLNTNPPRTASVDTLYQWDVTYWAEDQDQNPTATVSVEVGPFGMQKDNASTIGWTPSIADVGPHSVTIRVTDSLGAYVELPYTLTVGANQPPVIHSHAGIQAKVGQPFRYVVVASDAEDLPATLNYDLLQKPMGADFDANALEWTPTVDQVGDNPFVVQVLDSGGGTDEEAFVVTVSTSGRNHRPEIRSVPPETVRRGEVYRYHVDADDPDGDPLTLKLASTIGFKTLADDPFTLVMNTANLVDGVYYNTITVSDTQFAEAAQDVYVTVSANGDNHRPIIRSTPPALVKKTSVDPDPVQFKESYTVDAEDPDDDPLTKSRITCGNWAETQEPVADLIFTEPGTYICTVGVMDDEDAETVQVYSVTASTNGLNLPPIITTNPVRRVVAGRTYTYPVEAIDDGGPLPAGQITFDPSSARPAGLTFNPPGTLSWTTTTNDVGPYNIAVRATDPRDAWDVQMFTLKVTPNTPPRISSRAPQYALAGVTYTYQIAVIDPDDQITTGDPCTTGLKFEFVSGGNPFASGPAPIMAVDCNTGLITWTPTLAQVSGGPWNFEVKVSDPNAQTATEKFRIQVIDPNDPDTQVATSLRVGVDAVLLDSQTFAHRLEFVAEDELGDPEVTATVEINTSGANFAPDPNFTDMEVTLSNGFAAVNYPASGSLQPGVYRIVATAVNTLGLEATAVTEFLVGSGNASTRAAEITAPLPDVNSNGTWKQIPITDVTNLYGKAYSSDFYKYTVSYRRLSDGPSGDWVDLEVNSPYTPVGHANSSGLLAAIDPSALVNGLHEIRVEVYDRNDQVSTYIDTYLIDGNKKIGNFTMSFTDLEVPVGGIPVSITRTYDSRVKSKGDFGIGWRLEFASLALEESVDMADYWSATFFQSHAGGVCYVDPSRSHAVTLTWPDGRAEIFEAVMTPTSNGASGGQTCIATGVHSIIFQPRSLSTSKLVLKTPLPETWNPAVSNGILGGDVDGTTPWAPLTYELTTADGTKYLFEKAFGPDSRVARLTTVTDTTGNWIRFDRDKVTTRAGVSVSIWRDPATGRVAKIVDPKQNEIQYEYNRWGDLERVIDREENATTFQYNQRHELVDIVDPRGRSVARNVYDDRGRLVANIDAEGNRIEYQHCVDDDASPECANEENREVVLDRLGNATIFEYENAAGPNLGNILLKIDALSNTTGFEYDARGNNTLTRVVVGQKDGPDGPLPGDPPDVVTSQGFDSKDNLLFSVDADGNRTDYGYDNAQRPILITGPTEVQTANTYVGANLVEVRVKKVGEPDQVTSYGYDANRGLRTSETDANGEVSEFDYDGAGRMNYIADRNGAETEYEYDAVGNRTKTIRHNKVPGLSTVDQITTSNYDKEGRLVYERNPEGQETVITYNRLGKQESVQTASGVTWYSYDVRGNLDLVEYPDSSSEASTYDREGRRIAGRDRDNRYSLSEYDKLGRVTKAYALTEDEDNPSSGRPFSSTRYDAAGRVLRSAQVAADGSTNGLTKYEYGRSEQTVKTFPDSANTNAFLAYRNEYDEGGRIERVTDPNNRHIEYSYDRNGNRTRTNFPDAGTISFTEATYDAMGRRLSESDEARRTTQFGYDPEGHLTRVTDAHLIDTLYGYDDAGNLVRQEDAEGRVTTMAYDRLGRLKRRTLPPIADPAHLGQTMQLFETFDYDAAGNLWKHTDFAGDVTEFIYDSNGRMTLKKLPFVQFGASLSNTALGLNAAVDFTYRANGRIDIVCNYRMAGGLTADIDSIAIVDDSDDVFVDIGTTGSPIATNGTLTYDSVNTNAIDDLVAGKLYLRVTTSAASPNNVIKSPIYGASPFVEYAYTPGGARTRAGVDEFTYNERGQLHTQVNATEELLTYDYDGFGNRTDVTISTHGVTSYHVKYTFDDLNRLKTVKDVTRSNAETDYAYDNVGNLERVAYTETGATLPDNPSTHYVYDGRYRLDSMTNGFKVAGSAVTARFDYTVGPAGNRLGVDDYSTNGTVARKVNYVYDDLYRLIGESIDPDPGVANDEIDVVYNYDDVGNRQSRTEFRPQLVITTTYAYDDNDRLVKETVRQDGTVAAVDKLMGGDDRHFADGREKPTRFAGQAIVGFVALVITLGLAPFFLLHGTAGKAARRRQRFLAAIAAFLTPLMAVDQNAVYALHTEAMTRHAVMAALAANTVTTTVLDYTYDANGNLVGKFTAGRQVAEYAYDAENRLVRFDPHDPAKGPAGVVYYTYDADGIRRTKTVAGVTTRFVVDKNRDYAQVLEEWQESWDATAASVRAFEAVRFVHGNDLISQTRFDAGTSPQTRYFYFDGQTSTRVLADQAGERKDQYVYDAFGNEPVESTGQPTRNTYRYAGEQLEAHAAVYYLRARYYAPATGRFGTRDPFDGNPIDPLTLHKYIYAGSQPVTRVDPSGKFFGFVGLFGASFIQAKTRTAHTATVVGAEQLLVRKIIAIALFEVLLVALITAVAIATLTSELAELARTLHITISKDPPPEEPGYTYFLHGTTFLSWRGSALIDYAGGKGDFGPGYYTTRLRDPGSLAVARYFSSISMKGPDDKPFVFVLRAKDSVLEALNTKDLTNSPEEWRLVVNSGKISLVSGYDLVIGPVSGLVLNDPAFSVPNQYVFKSPKVGLEFVTLIP
jgi:RHS repeat-associated protein